MKLTKSHIIFRNSHLLYTSFNKSYLLFSLLFVFSSSFAQKEKKENEVINITSGFKPKILPADKIQFYASIPVKDTTPFSFSYQSAYQIAKSNLKSFLIKPLALSLDSSNGNGMSGFSKLGYGNLQNPFAQLAFQSTQDNIRFTAWADHISAKGKLADQQYSNSSLGGLLQNNLSSFEKLSLYGGYTFDAYRQYGYDHSSFSYPRKELLQQYKRGYSGISYYRLLGPKKNIIITPTVDLGFLSTSNATQEISVNVNMPFTYQWRKDLSFFTTPVFELAGFRNNVSQSKTYHQLQLPLQVSYTSDNLKLSGGVIGVKSAHWTIAPLFDLSYRVSDTRLNLLASIKNDFLINSFQYLRTQNSFIAPPDSLSFGRKSTYSTGINWSNESGFQTSFLVGFAKFTGLPLFINSGVSGKDLRILLESSLSAIQLHSTVDYVLSEQFKFSSDANAYFFQSQKVYDKPYGFIPIEIHLELNYKPISSLTISLHSFIWKGAMASTEPLLSKKLDNVADINLGVDYKLNKKWGFWIDLNNIANMHYQRWNQYQSYGFNFLSGLRYSFLKSSKN